MLDDFIDKIPKADSHYCRKTTSKIFIQQDVTTWKQLHNIYKETVKGHKTYKMTVFRARCKARNLSLFRPKKDRCDTCVKGDLKHISPEDFKNHRLEVDEFRSKLGELYTQAKDGTVKMIQVDVQNTQLLPNIAVRSAFYCQKLVVHNYTLYDCSTKDSICFYFNETAAGLTASVFISMLVYLIKKTYGI